jgi:hypothetical protein
LAVLATGSRSGEEEDDDGMLVVVMMMVMMMVTTTTMMVSPGRGNEQAVALLAVEGVGTGSI